MRYIEREEQLRNESTGREARRDSEETCAEVAIDARPVNKKHLSDNVLTRFFHHLASKKKSHAPAKAAILSFSSFSKAYVVYQQQQQLY